MPDQPDVKAGAVAAGTQAARTGAEMGRAATDAGAGIGRAASDSAGAMGNDFMKMFADMKLPAMPDMGVLMDAHRRNLETLSAANRVALEGAQTVARRHMEIMQQTMQELGEGMRQLASPEAPQAKAVQQSEMLKRSYEQAMANMHELRDLIQTSNGQALELLNKRFMEAVDEVKGLVQKSQSAQRG